MNLPGHNAPKPNSNTNVRTIQIKPSLIARHLGVTSSITMLPAVSR